MIVRLTENNSPDKTNPTTQMERSSGTQSFARAICSTRSGRSWKVKESRVKVLAGVAYVEG